MPATDSPLGASPATSRDVSRLRRGNHDARANNAANDTANASTPSLVSRASSTTGDESTDPAEMRSSMDTAIGKVRDRSRRNSDARRGSDESGRRLSALIERGSRKLKRKDKSNTNINSSTLGVHSGESGELAFSDGRSEGSLVDEDGNNSLFTDDGSDHDGKPVRPTISPHQSHAAFLTLSSPQLQAQPAQSQSTSNLSQEITDDPDVALPSNDSTSSLPQIIEPPGNTSPISKSAARRNRNASPSPADKLRAGFARNRRKSSEAAKSGAGESGVLGGIGGLFKPRSRRSSISSPEPVNAEPQEPPLIQADPEEAVSAVQPSAENVAAPETPSAAAAASVSSEGQTQTPQDTPRRGRVNTSSSLPDTPQSHPGSPTPGTPTTLVTPPTPTDPSNSTFSQFPSPGKKQSPSKPLSSVESIRHRRAQSQTLPSKLSNSIAAPLTPTIEEAKTPGGTLTQPTTATGFFSSVFNVAQKAADQLSASVNTGAKNKASAKATENGGDEVISGAGNDSNTDLTQQRAIETLGKGNLSLTQLGIADPMSSTTDLPRQQDETNGAAPSNKLEEDAAARAVSSAYEKPVASAVSQAMGARPLSIASQDRLTLNGDQTPPRSGADGDGMKRSGSVRSKISGRRRRHRENSNATTMTNATAVNSIGAALKDSASGFSSAANTTGPGHRHTGFAVASSKRNKDFHQLFRSVPEDDYLIEDYSAALQKEILLQGRLYVSEGHICFSSNIFGWVTNLVISFDEVLSVEKKNTAVVFPNALVITTPHARNTFASFVARDSTYELLIGIWKINHPKLKSSLNGVVLDNVGASDKTEKAASIASEDDSDEGSEDEVYDEDDDDDDFGSYTEPDGGRSIAGSDVGEPMLSRKTSVQPLGAAAPINGNLSRTMDAAEAAAAGVAPGGDFPGPHAHAPTECSDTAEHYDRPLTDVTIPAPLGKVYSLMFGPASGTFMKKWLVDDQKSRELDFNDDKTGLDNDHKSFTFSYIKPLNAPVGPKQTKCITTNTLEAFDLEKAVTVNCSTQTPDVPSGSIFTTKTKYCLMWGPGNSTRMIANCTIEWTGKSWLRGPIESGAQGGQTQYVKDIIAALTAAVSTKVAKAGPAGRKGKRKGRKEAADDNAASGQPVAAVAVKEPNWGLFEPLRGPLDPFVSLLRPFFTSQVVIAILFTLLMYSWFFASRSSSSNSGLGFSGNADRAVAYEEIWRREESELWDWLEDRVGLDGTYAPGAEGRQQVMGARAMGKRLESEGMRGRQVDDAIRITEERLGALKGAVEREKEQGGKK